LTSLSDVPVARRRGLESTNLWMDEEQAKCQPLYLRMETGGPNLAPGYRWREMAADQSLVTLLGATLGGLGVGAIATAVVQHVLGNRAASERLRFDERKEAFLALLDAILVTDLLGEGSTPEADARLRHAEVRVRLVASGAVLRHLDRWNRDEPHTPARTEAVNELYDAMRLDLGVASDGTKAVLRAST
jgi:hypothetical protein